MDSRELADIGQSFGDKIVQAMKDTILEGVDPPNATSTIKRKGSDISLIETGEMLARISSRVEVVGQRIVIDVGIFDPELAKRAVVNEFHPKHPRPFGRITADTKVPKIAEEIEEEFDAYFEKKFRGEI